MSVLSQIRITEADNQPGSNHPQCQHRKVAGGNYILQLIKMYKYTHILFS